MGYQSQLVVRTRSPHGIEVIERVKELAEREGRTFSQMALELFERALDAPPEEEDVDASLDAQPELEVEEVEMVTAPPPTPQRTESKRVAGPAESAVRRKPTIAATEADRQVIEASGSPEAVAQECLSRLNHTGQESAARILAAFFAAAGPVEGGRIKKELQQRLSQDEYDAVFAQLKESAEYRTYKDRLISGF